MYWYELATAQEVENELEHKYRYYWDSQKEMGLHGEWVYSNPVNYCIAEQLWSEHNGEF